MLKQTNEIKHIFKNIRSELIYVGLFSLFINLLMLTPPLYMLQLYDRVVVSRSGETLLLLTLLVVSMFLVMGLLEFVRTRLMLRMGDKLDSLLKNRVFDAMLNMSLTDKSVGSQPLVDLNYVRQFASSQSVSAIFDFPWVFIYLGVLFLFHPWFGWFAVMTILLQSALAYVNEIRTQELLTEANTKNIIANGVINSHLKNAEIVHALGMGERVKSLWNSQRDEGINPQFQASDRSSIWANMSKTGRVMFQSLMLGLGGYLAITDQISPGMMIAGSILLGRVMAPLDTIVGSWKSFNGFQLAFDRLSELLRRFPEKDQKMSLPEPQGNLTLAGVVVKPPGSEEVVIKEVGFALTAGDVLGIIGPSSSGKSSLARVILGIWPYISGEVRIDGAEINQWDFATLGDHLGYLPQDVDLFSGTVAQNISRFGGVDSEKVVQAAQLAGVHDLILKMPQGYDTIIGPAGANLSGGQRQRVGLARAVYGEPKLIVLDEPNSNLDEVGEIALVQAIQTLKQKNVTVIIITHRTSVLNCVDKLLAMQEGRVALFGPREKVVAEIKNRQMAAKEAQNNNKIQ